MIHTPHLINKMHHMGRKEHYIISIMLRDFGMMMVEVFVPILLLIGGMSLLEVALFFTFGSGLRLLTQSLNPFMFRTFGVQHTMVLGYIFSVSYIISLNYITTNTTTLILSAALYALMSTFFWVPRHVDTADVVSGGRASKKLSYLGIASTVLGIIAPFLGGVLAEYFSPQVLFATVFGIMLSAVIALSSELAYETNHRKHSPKIRNVLTKQDWKAYGQNFANNYQSQSSGYIWPLFIFVSVQNLGTIGAIFAFNSVMVMGLFYVIGKQKKQARFIHLGALIRILSVLLMPFANSTARVLGIDLINSSGRGTLSIGYNNYYYNNAHKSADPAAHIIMTETIGELAKLMMWGLLALIVWLGVSSPFTIMFLLGAVLHLPLLLIKD